MRENRGWIIHPGQDGRRNEMLDMLSGPVHRGTFPLVSPTPTHWWSTCQEPLILNTESDLTDKLSRCCRPMASLAARQCVTSPAETAERALDLDASADTIVGKYSSQNGNHGTHQKKWIKMIRSRNSFGRLASPSMHSDTVAGATSASWAPLSHDGSSWGCVPFHSGRAGRQCW